MGQLEDNHVPWVNHRVSLVLWASLRDSLVLWEVLPVVSQDLWVLPPVVSLDLWVPLLVAHLPAA